MWAELPEAERRYLLRGALTAMASVLLLVAFWVSPVSPVALDRTASKAASGDAEGAVAALSLIHI